MSSRPTAPAQEACRAVPYRSPGVVDRARRGRNSQTRLGLVATSDPWTAAVGETSGDSLRNRDEKGISVYLLRWALGLVTSG